MLHPRSKTLHRSTHVLLTVVTSDFIVWIFKEKLVFVLYFFVLIKTGKGLISITVLIIPCWVVVINTSSQATPSPMKELVHFALTAVHSPPRPVQSSLYSGNAPRGNELSAATELPVDR